MKNAAIAAALAVALAGCGPLTVAAIAIGGAATAYCAGTSDAAKRLARDTLAAGRQVIACGAPAVGTADE